MATDSTPPTSDRSSMQPSTGRPLSLIGAVGWTFFTAFLALFTMDVSRWLRPGLAHDLINLEFCVALACLVTVYGIVRLHTPSLTLSEALGLRATSFALYPLALLVGLLLQLPANWLEGLIESCWPRGSEELEALASLAHLHSGWYRVVFAAVTTALGPFVEEVLFRGAIFRALRRTHRSASTIAVTAFLFALLHFDPRLLVPVFVSGIVLGVLRDQGGSLVLSLLAHMVFNGATTFGILSGRVQLGEVEAPMRWTLGAAGSAATLMVLVLFVLVAMRNEQVRTSRIEDAR